MLVSENGRHFATLFLKLGLETWRATNEYVGANVNGPIFHKVWARITNRKAVASEREGEREINGINLFTQGRGRQSGARSSVRLRQTDDYKTDDAHRARSAQVQKIFDLSLPPSFFWERARGLDVEMLGGGLKHLDF